VTLERKDAHIFFCFQTGFFERRFSTEEKNRTFAFRTKTDDNDGERKNEKEKIMKDFQTKHLLKV
jgi:hypothetical protein